MRTRVCGNTRFSEASKFEFFLIPVCQAHFLLENQFGEVNSYEKEAVTVIQEMIAIAVDSSVCVVNSAAVSNEL